MRSRALGSEGLSVSALRDAHPGRSGWVEIPVGDEAAEAAGPGAGAAMQAYVARPAADGHWPAVLVGFEMFGITGYVCGIADRLAAAGYVAIVPDFYHRHRPPGSHVELPADADGRTRGLELVSGLQRHEVRADVEAVIEHLAGRDDSSGQVAIVGLSAGGHIAYYAATQTPLAALVVFYPGWLTGTEIALSQPEPTLTLTPSLAALRTPVLFMVGEGDHLFTDQQRQQIATRLQEAGVRHELVIYPDTPHGFFCDERDTYRPEAADDAWQRTLKLLSSRLGEKASA